MIDTDKIRKIVEVKLKGSNLFLVDIKSTPSNEIEVLIDSDSSVGIDSCIELSRAIEAEFDREEEDFELTVASSGIGQPLKVLRQYQKLIGKSIEVVLKNGLKILAELREVSPESISLCYYEKVAVEGKKRKQDVEVTKTFAMEEIKVAKEYLDFK